MKNLALQLSMMVALSVAAPVRAADKPDTSEKDLCLLYAQNCANRADSIQEKIGKLKDGADRQSRIDATRKLGDDIAALDQELAAVDADLKGATSTVPNIPDARTPLGVGDDDDVLLKTVGLLMQDIRTESLRTYEAKVESDWVLVAL